MIWWNRAESENPFYERFNAKNGGKLMPVQIFQKLFSILLTAQKNGLSVCAWETVFQNNLIGNPCKYTFWLMELLIAYLGC